jgi:hypothetical protein
LRGNFAGVLPHLFAGVALAHVLRGNLLACCRTFSPALP